MYFQLVIYQKDFNNKKENYNDDKKTRYKPKIK